MSLMDNLKKLTQPYGDGDDFYEGAEGEYAPQEPAEMSTEQREFEATFLEEGAEQAVQQPKKQMKLPNPSGIFGGHGGGEARAQAQKPQKASRKGGTPDQTVFRFIPKNFDEAGELVNYLDQGRSLIMSLEEIPAETARRLLDFMSGIAFAMNGKINPVSAKTYFITPENVDLLDAQASSEPDDTQ